MAAQARHLTQKKKSAGFGNHVPRVEADPSHILKQHNSRRHQQLPKGRRLHAILLVALKVDAGAAKQVDGLLSVHVLAADANQSTERWGMKKKEANF